MSLLIVEGFDGFGDNADLQRMWRNTNNSVTFVTGRMGVGQAMALTGSSNAVHFPLPVVLGGELILQFAWRYNDDTLAAVDILRFYDQGSLQCTIVAQASGTVQMNLSNSTLVQRSAGTPLSSKAWHYLELKLNIGNTGTFTLNVDGIEVLDSVSDDIDVTGSGNVDEFAFLRSSSQPQIDDLIVMDTAGLVNNDFLGDCAVETTFPDGDGNRNDFAPLSGLTNYEMVDDGATPDDDTTYNFGGTVGDDELYTHGALTLTADVIPGISVRNHCQKIDAGLRTIGTLVRSNVTEATGADRGCRVGYGYYDEVLETDPDGGGAWNQAAVEAAEYGLTIKA